jgi:SAM-dependent methyltransferase
MGTLRTMTVNEEQIASWNGPQGDVWVAMQERLDKQLLSIGHATIEALAPRAGERILDIGCGAGQSTLELAARVGASGRVLGVDISEPLLALARRRRDAAGTAHADFVVGDAQIYSFESGYDAIYSRFGVMFFADPSAAFANLAQALRPGGRLAFACWRRPDENPIMMAPLLAAIGAGLTPPEPTPPNAPGPFAFADRERVAGILAGAGFGDIVHTPRDAPMGGNDLDAAVDLAFRVGPLSRLLRDQPERRASVEEAVRAALAKHVVDGVVQLPSATWIVTATRG